MTTINSVIELQIILALLMICGIVLTNEGSSDGRWKKMSDGFVD